MTNLDILTLKMRWSNIKRVINWQLDKPSFKCRFCGVEVGKNELCPKCGMGQEIKLERHDMLALLKYIEYLEGNQNANS